jgi:hypothetical protein
MLARAPRLRFCPADSRTLVYDQHAKVWMPHPTESFQVCTVKGVQGGIVTGFDAEYKPVTAPLASSSGRLRKIGMRPIGPI